MGVKIISLLFLAIFLQGFAITEIRLDDRSLTFITNDLVGTAIGIAKSWQDSLEVCMVTFPNGIRYEAFPNDNTPNTVTFEKGVQPFTSCAIGFRGVSVSMSGTYELESLVLHSSTNSYSLTRQRFHLTFREPTLD